MAPFTVKSRYCRSFDGATYFKPQGIPMRHLQIIKLELDELEAIHLCDYEGLDQAETAKKMKISSSTVQRLLYSGRKKIIDALYTSKAIEILKPPQVSEYTEPRGHCFRRKRCKRNYFTKEDDIL